MFIYLILEKLFFSYKMGQVLWTVFLVIFPIFRHFFIILLSQYDIL